MVYQSRQLRHKRVTVMGLGLHGGGVGVVRWLAEQGARVTVTDLKTAHQLRSSIAELGRLPITFVFGKHRVEDFTETDLVVKNPGVPAGSRFLRAARRRSVPITSDVSLFVERCPAPVVGVTGTKGKSTTATLCYRLLDTPRLKAVLAGNIRVSPLGVLDRVTKSTPVVLELSSWQLEDVQESRWSPQIAVITNILPDHRDRYRSHRTYAAAKQLILKHQHPGDYAVLNYDDPTVCAFARHCRGKVFWFSTRQPVGNGCYWSAGTLFFSHNGKARPVLEQAQVRLAGEHNQANVAAAVTVAMLRKVPRNRIRAAVKAFTGVAYRLETVQTWKGIRFINDTAATSPVAAVASLQSVPAGVTLIAGGHDKRLPLHQFVTVIGQRAAHVILLAGSATDALAKQLRRRQIPFTVVHSMRAAVVTAIRVQRAPGVVLLSPGAASFGMFANEFDRGDQFNAVVKELTR